MSFYPYLPRGFVVPTALRCIRCRHLLPLAHFYTRSDRPVWTRGHWSSDCRECQKAIRLAKYQADPKAAAARRKRNRAQVRANQVALSHISADAKQASHERREADRIKRLIGSFDHSLRLHLHPYPKGYPHSFAARARIERIRKAAEVAVRATQSEAQAVPETHTPAAWARESLTPAEAMAVLRAMHQAQNGLE